MTTPQKTALITGVTGQDGSYLAEFLLEKGNIDALRDWGHATMKSKAVLATRKKGTVLFSPF